MRIGCSDRSNMFYSIFLERSRATTTSSSSSSLLHTTIAVFNVHTWGAQHRQCNDVIVHYNVYATVAHTVPYLAPLGRCYLSSPPSSRPNPG